MHHYFWADLALILVTLWDSLIGEFVLLLLIGLLSSLLVSSACFLLDFCLSDSLGVSFGGGGGGSICCFGSVLAGCLVSGVSAFGWLIWLLDPDCSF